MNPIQKKIAKMPEVNVHYNGTHTIANYICDFGKAKNRYERIEEFVEAIKLNVNVEIESFYTTKGKKRSEMIFTVEIKFQ